jgi:tRNA A37 threonylcarbamoyltransferase TsaD
MLNRKDLNFSFSGLKTAVLYKVREIEKVIRSDSGVIHRDLLSEKKSRGEAANHHQLPNHSFFSPQPTTIAHRPSPLITQPPNHHQSRAAGANHLITCRQALITQSPLYQSLIAHEFQQTVIDILIGKTLQAARKYHPKSICLCGGVSANQELREQMAQQITQSLNHNKSPNHLITFHVPPLSLTTDNAAMIGIAAAYHLDQQTTWDKIKADANMEL